MQWLDVVLFGVIVVVGYGFARMGFRLSYGPAVDVLKRGKDSEEKTADGKQTGGERREDGSPNYSRLASGVFFAGFGMVIIWVAIDRYLPLVVDGRAAPSNSADTQPSDVMGEIVLKVTVLRSPAEPDASEQAPAAKPKIGVRVEEVSWDDASSDPSVHSWQWLGATHHKSLPRPTLFAGKP